MIRSVFSSGQVDLLIGFLFFSFFFFNLHAEELLLESSKGAGFGRLWICLFFLGARGGGVGLFDLLTLCKYQP